MISRLVVATTLVLLAASGRTQEAGAPEGFAAGRAFANSKAGKAAAGASIGKESGAANVPKFNLSPPEASVFGEGKLFIGTAGQAKQAGCATHVAGSTYAQQECDAVNYLSKAAGQGPRYALDRNTDPLLVGSRPSIDHPGTASPGGAAACYLVTTTAPGTFTEERCERSARIDSISCNKTLLPECGYRGAPINGYLASHAGAFTVARMSASGRTGLYDWLLEVPYRRCGDTGSAQLEFKLDTVGEGGYITLQMSNLDDAAAVAVNGTAVFAGYPNNGPHYGGDVLSGARADFQLGYQWEEDVGREVCVTSDAAGQCTATAHQPQLRQFNADTKLLDTCPAGYVPTLQGAVSDADTSLSRPGFFCNAEGKFLMNRHEGIGTWSGSVSSSIPLRVGTNYVSAFWGTTSAGDACGNGRVSGQIYNVAPGCGSSWDDQCAPLRAAVGK